MRAEKFRAVSVDAVRAFWDARPCNIRHSAEPVGTAAYFDEVEARKYFVEPHIPAFADFHRWRGKRVLELGCGIGTDTINFARAGAQVTAVDLSPQSLAIARRRAEVFGVADAITFHEADGERLSEVVPVEPYDLIYSFGVVHHTPHPERALAELRRYAARGGTLKLMVYNRRSWKVFRVLMGVGKGRFWKLPEVVAQYSEAQTGCPVTYTYTKAQAKQVVESARFRVTGMTIDHVFPYRIEDYKQHRQIKEWYFRWMPPPLFRAFERVLGWHLLVTAVPR